MADPVERRFSVPHAGRQHVPQRSRHSSEPAEGPSAGRRPLISIVIPCYNEESVLPLLVQRLRPVADRLAPEYRVEILFIDDGSGDGTWSAILETVAADGRFRGVRLSRNFGHQAALSCGYSLAEGEAVISMDADLQDPPEIVPRLIDRWRHGADVVLAVRTRRAGETVFKRASAGLFYRVLRKLGADHVRADCGDLRLMSRRSLDALLRLGERHRFVRGMVGWIGFRTDQVEFERPGRAAGVTKYPLRKMLRLAADAVVSFSRVPLRVAYYAAAALSLVFGAYLAYAAASAAWFGTPLDDGWAVLILATIAFGAANLLSQALTGEYVGRIYEECKGRPLFLVQEVAANPSNVEVSYRPAEVVPLAVRWDPSTLPAR